MANPADEWSGADLAAVQRGGVINEEVMQQIWDISRIPLPFQDRCASMNVGNSLHTWVKDKLSDPDVTNKVIDGLDNVKNDAKRGSRVGNHSQISTKAVSVTTRAQNSNVIGAGNELALQISRRQQELRRDREAILMNNQSSLADDGATVAGTLGGLPSWIETNITVGATTGAAGGYNPATGLTVAYTPGDAAAISEADLRDKIQAIYEQGGESSVLMARPAVIRKISEYMFTSTARIATLQADQGRSGDAATALGTVNMFVSDFGSVELVANRLQQPAAAGVSEAFILDFSLLAISYLHGYKTEPLAKTGLADKRQMSVDGSLCVKNEEGLAMIADIDETAAMVA